MAVAAGPGGSEQADRAAARRTASERGAGGGARRAEPAVPGVPGAVPGPAGPGRAAEARRRPADHAGRAARAGADVPPGHRRPAGLRAVSKLTPAERRRLIAPGGVGRIAFNTGSGPVVLPVNFSVLDDTLVIRTAEGTIIDGHAGEQVALEVDHIDEALCQGWSVLARGGAPRRAPGRTAPPAAGRRGLAVARRRARGLRAHHPQPGHRPPHRDPLKRPRRSRSVCAIALTVAG